MFYFIALGSNLGCQTKNLEQAIGLLKQHIGTIVAESGIVGSEPWHFESDNSFANSVVVLNTGIESPEQVLRLTQQIEISMGRNKKTTIVNGTPVYHDRIIDIDLLTAYPDNTFKHILQRVKGQNLHADYATLADIIALSIHVNSQTLTLPHPFIMQRPFVCTPLSKVLDKLALE